MKYSRRKFLVGGLAAVGSSAVVGSGAFNLVSASRAVTIQTASDNDAYLGLSANDPHAGNYVAETGEDETIEFDFAGGSEDDNPFAQNGDGVNPNAVTVFEDAFNVANQSDGTDVGIHADDVPEEVRFVVDEDSSGNTDIDISQEWADLDSGEDFDVTIEFTADFDDETWDEVTFLAEEDRYGGDSS